jgi:hypothetical protein
VVLFDFKNSIEVIIGYEAKKTEHSGSKKGCGAYWGQKVDAKKQSNRERREQDKITNKGIKGE